jgi:hypothetical protein
VALHQTFSMQHTSDRYEGPKVDPQRSSQSLEDGDAFSSPLLEFHRKSHCLLEVENPLQLEGSSSFVVDEVDEMISSLTQNTGRCVSILSSLGLQIQELFIMIGKRFLICLRYFHLPNL